MKRIFIYLVLFFLMPTFIFAQNTGERSASVKDGGPAKAVEFEINRTKDPATGKVPKAKYLEALMKTIELKNDAVSRSTAAFTWVERGPTSDVPGPSNGNTRANSGLASGRIRAMMVDSLDATHKTVFVGGIDGGLWKTTDITATTPTWTPVNDFMSNLAIAAICQDPRPGFQNIMYLCTGESYYNVDAVQGVGVFKSINGGATWTFLPSTSTYVNGTRILCDFQGNIYLATRGSGLLRSTAASGGTAWTAITPTGLPADICDLEISSTSAAGRLHVVSGIFSTQLYRYTDIPATVAAGTWTAPVVAFPSVAMRCEIAVRGNTLYACPANGSYQVPTIYRSVDGGANWAATATQPASGGWANGQGWYSLEVAIDPSDPNICIVGGLDNYKTINAGATWTNISAWVGAGQYVHADQHKMLWYDGGNKLIFASDGGVFYSTDKGTTIRDRNLGLRIKQFYSCAIHPTTTNYFLAGAQDNGSHQFSNAGLSTSVEVTGGDGAFVAIDQDQPQYQFTSYVYNQYRRSTNSGATWTPVNLSASTGQFINPIDYDNTANIMYCCNTAGTYRRWTNPQSGSTSATVTITALNGQPATAVTVSPYTANRIFLGTNNFSGTSRVCYVDGANTIASGSAGTNISTGLPTNVTTSCIAVGTTDNNLMVCFSNYGVSNIWVSTNLGTSWIAIDGNLPDMPVRWCMFYPGNNTKAIIATETGIWQTDLINGASTVWVAETGFPTVRTDMIKFRKSDGTLAAGTHGRGLWTTTLIPNITVNLKLFLQGYYLSASTMQPVLNNHGVPATLATETDSVIVELHDATTFAKIDSRRAILTTSGLVSTGFFQPAGSYYIAIRHRNTIETWSTNPVALSSATPLYNFSSASAQAYGNNQVQVQPGVWAFFTGDLNQDEFIDSNDFPAFDIDNFNGVNGVYVSTDMNGDGFVDSNDFPVFDSNSFNAVSSAHP